MAIDTEDKRRSTQFLGELPIPDAHVGPFDRRHAGWVYRAFRTRSPVVSYQSLTTQASATARQTILTRCGWVQRPGTNAVLHAQPLEEAD
jgi:hypothetical protein